MTREYWEAANRGELVLPWCTACDRPFWYPRHVCPGCLGDTVEYRTASGAGEVYAVSVQHKPGPMRPTSEGGPVDGPYAVVLVDLAEGVRVMGNVLGCAPDDVKVGMAVRATFVDRSEGRKLLQFEPA